jgi:hypothetical protein
MYVLQIKTFSKRDGEIMKYFVYSSDYYYPGGDAYYTLTEALAAFEKLKERRKGEMEYDRNAYFETDYLCIVLDEIDKEKMKLEQSPVALPE